MARKYEDLSLLKRLFQLKCTVRLTLDFGKIDQASHDKRNGNPRSIRQDWSPLINDCANYLLKRFYLRQKLVSTHFDSEFSKTRAIVLVLLTSIRFFAENYDVTFHHWSLRSKTGETSRGETMNSDLHDPVEGRLRRDSNFAVRGSSGSFKDGGWLTERPSTWKTPVDSGVSYSARSFNII